ncbi:hypothetical protein AB2B38_001360 [Balneola sp. MJW-20]
MNAQQWIDLYIILITLISNYLLIRTYLYSRVNVYLILIAGLNVYSLYYLFDITGLIETELLGTWTDFLAIVLCICALLVMIRNSKPIFARFPIYLTGLPLLSILFFPLVMRSLVINDLISAIFQGGAIASACILFSLDHFKNQYRAYFIGGMGMLIISYILYWFKLNTWITGGFWVPEIISSTAFMILSLAFYQRNIKKHQE